MAGVHRTLQGKAPYRVYKHRVPVGTSTGLRLVTIVFTEEGLQMMGNKENMRRMSVLQSLQILALLVFVLTSL